jgi:hypothetical protein
VNNISILINPSYCVFRFIWDGIWNLNPQKLIKGTSSKHHLCMHRTEASLTANLWLMKEEMLFGWGRHDNSVNIVPRLHAGRPGFYSRQGQGFFPLLYRIQTGSGAHPAYFPVGTPGLNRPGRVADHSHPSNVEIKNTRSYTFAPPYVFMA